jgi:hypothetical protein
LIEDDYEDTTHNPICPPFLESCGSACNVRHRFGPTGGGSGYFAWLEHPGYNFFGYGYNQLFYFAIQSAKFADSIADHYNSAAET